MALALSWLNPIFLLLFLADSTMPPMLVGAGDAPTLQSTIENDDNKDNNVHGHSDEQHRYLHYEQIGIPVNTENFLSPKYSKGIGHAENSVGGNVMSNRNRASKRTSAYHRNTVQKPVSYQHTSKQSHSQTTQKDFINDKRSKRKTSKNSFSPSTSPISMITSSPTKSPRFHWPRRRPCDRQRPAQNISFPPQHDNLSLFHLSPIPSNVSYKQTHVPGAPYRAFHRVPHHPGTRRNLDKNDKQIESVDENNIRNTMTHQSISTVPLPVDNTKHRKINEANENGITSSTSAGDQDNHNKIHKTRRSKRAAIHEKLKRINFNEKRKGSRYGKGYVIDSTKTKPNAGTLHRDGNSDKGYNIQEVVNNSTPLSSLGKSKIPGSYSGTEWMARRSNSHRDSNEYDNHRHRHYHRRRRHRLRRQSTTGTGTTTPRRRRPSSRPRRPFGGRDIIGSGRRRPGTTTGLTRNTNTNTTARGKPVSLKVVVHISVSRDYQRILDSAIRTQAWSRQFRMIQKHIRPSGRIVRLRNDRPKDILQAFCNNILTPDTTTVVHLMNPFYHSRNWDSARYVAGLLGSLNIPTITWGPEYIGALAKKESDSTQLNISPTLHHQARALISLLAHYQWPFFAVVYTSVPGHEDFLTSIRIALRDRNNYHHRHHNGSTSGHKTGHSGLHEEYRLEFLTAVEMTNVSSEAQIGADLKRVMATDARIIILYCQQGETLTLLEQASSLGMMTQEYLWILSFEAINKNKEHNAKYLPLGLLGLQYNHMRAAMERAIRTAVSVWFHGLKQAVLSKGNASSPLGTTQGFPWKLPNLQCRSNSTLEWRSGHEFFKFLKNISLDNNVKFDDNGQLDATNISIYNVQSKGVGVRNRKWVEIGRWTKDGIFMKQITWPGGSPTPPRGKPERHFLRIVTRAEPPFVEYRDLNKNGSCDMFSSPCTTYHRDINDTRMSTDVVQKCCTGLSIEILRKLAVALDFEFHLYEVPDFQWGTKMENGEWNGIVGELRAGHADMGVASMTIDEDKSGAINFSTPYMETGITFIVAIREGAVSATAFLEPYDYPSWCLILLCSVHVTGASIFLFEWLSPDGMDHGKKGSAEHRFSLFRAFWLMWAMLFGAAVTTDSPRGVSSKFLSNIWALFALVFTASYTANLAAFMITKEEFYDLSGMQDWRLQNPYAMNPPFRFATVPNGTAENNIKKNNPGMYQYMAKYSQTSVEHAIDALKSQTLHAFIYDASVLKYQEGKDKDCMLITVGNWYATTGYGVSFPVGSPWLEKVNKVILKLQYEGEMDRLKEFWLAGACHTKRKKTNNNRGIGNGVSSATLGILNFASAFIFLLAGTGLAAIVFVMEFCFLWFGRKKLSAWSNKDCCNLISLSMGETLSFRDSVREAMEAHRKAKAKQCTSVVCETKLWKANFELKEARAEIDKLQLELERLNDEEKTTLSTQPAPVPDSSGDAADPLDDTMTDRPQGHSVSQSYPFDVDENEKKEYPVNQSHCAEVHNLTNGDVTTSASQSNWPACLLSDDDEEDEEKSVRVTLL